MSLALGWFVTDSLCSFNGLHEVGNDIIVGESPTLGTGNAQLVQQLLCLLHTHLKTHNHGIVTVFLIQ